MSLLKNFRTPVLAAVLSDRVAGDGPRRRGNSAESGSQS